MRSLRDNIDKCPILPPQQDMVEVLYNIRISTSFRYRALRSIGQQLGRLLFNNIGCRQTNNVKKCANPPKNINQQEI